MSGVQVLHGASDDPLLAVFLISSMELDLQPGDVVKVLESAALGWVRARVIRVKSGGRVVVQSDQGREFTARGNQVRLIEPAGFSSPKPIVSDLFWSLSLPRRGGFFCQRARSLRKGSISQRWVACVHQNHGLFSATSLVVCLEPGQWRSVVLFRSDQ